MISRSAARPIFDEVRRWVEHGLDQSGLAHESLMYPLAALVPHGKKILTPLEDVQANDIAELVIDGVAIPPDTVKSFSSANCHFSGDVDGANLVFNAHIEALLARAPRLSVLSKLHAHPFEGGCFLSGGDLHHGVNAPKARAWRQRRGLATAILHVVHPDAIPGKSPGPWSLRNDGAIGRDHRGRPMRWKIHTWASVGASVGASFERPNDDAAMIDLGDAQVVSLGHRSVRAARRRPYWATRRGARYCDAQKKALRGAGYRVSRNLLGRGWRRYLVFTDRAQILIALPPDFPKIAPRVLQIRRAWDNDFEPLDLPRTWRHDTLGQASLLSLVQAYGRPALSLDAPRHLP